MEADVQFLQIIGVEIHENIDLYIPKFTNCKHRYALLPLLLEGSKEYQKNLADPRCLHSLC